MSQAIVKAAQLQNALKSAVWNQIRKKRLSSYLNSDRRPWREGYEEYKEEYLRNAINDPAIINVLRDGKELPPGYGYRLDARVIEIPWALARLAEVRGRFLDAGSALNHRYVLEAEALAGKQTTIMTLAPEGDAFWRLGVSYVFGDLRDTDFRDNRFDCITCISTIEHIGMDNSMYAGSASIAQRGDPKEFLLAVKELKRILRPGGILYISFPFGRYENHGWFQQFDSALLDVLVDGFAPKEFAESIFKYEPEGWIVSNRAACADCEFFDIHTSKYVDTQSQIEYPPDYPAGERGLACLELQK